MHPKGRKVQDNPEAVRFLYTDKSAGVLGEFPELTKAVRQHDLTAVCVLCAQLYESVVANSTMQRVSSPQ